MGLANVLVLVLSDSILHQLLPEWVVAGHNGMDGSHRLAGRRKRYLWVMLYCAESRQATGRESTGQYGIQMHL